MSSRFVRLLILLALIALVSIVFLLNPDLVLVSFWPGRTWRVPMALVLVIVFCAGVLITASVSLIIGVRLSFRYRRDLKRREVEREHIKQLVKVQEYLAAKDLDKVRVSLTRMLEQDPKNILTRTMLARALRNSGECHKALALLDETRAEYQKNLDVLVLSAKLNMQLGNLTAARDNWQLLLKEEPTNKFALFESVKLHEALGQMDRAVELQSQLVKLCSGDEYNRAQDYLAQLQLQRVKQRPADEQRSAVEDVLRKHRDFAPALAVSAELDERANQHELAAKQFMKAYKLSADAAYLARLAAIWLRVEDPSRAVSAVRSSLQSVESNKTGSGVLFLVSLLLQLELKQEARAELEKLTSNEDLLRSRLRCLKREQLDLIRVLILAQNREWEEATTHLRRLIDNRGIQDKQSSVLAGLVEFSGGRQPREQPAPQLSTP